MWLLKIFKLTKYINQLNFFTMKKLLLSFALVMGLGSAVSAAEATYPTTAGEWGEYTWTQDGTDFVATVGDFTFRLEKASSTNDLASPANTSGAIRVYAGAQLTITAPSGVTMTKVSGVTASSNKAVSATASEGWTVVTQPAANANNPFEFTATTGQQSITFDGDGKQLRIKSLTITSEGESADTREPHGLSYGVNSFEAEIGSNIALPVLSNPNNLAVAYTSSATEVATVDADGVVTLVAKGETTITATTEGNETYKSGSVSYKLTVTDPNAKGGKNNPYTVAEALAAEVANDVYVKGIVTSVSTWNSQYPNIDYYIADAADATETIKVFRGMWIDGADITAENQPVVGATVVVNGNLSTYSGANQIGQGSKIVSYEAPAKAPANLSFPEDFYSAEIGQEFTAPELSADTDAKITYASSNTEVATVDANTGAVTLVAPGTTVITATSVETEDFQAGTAEYTLKVVDPNQKGTINNPYTVAEALAVCAENPKDVYVKGIVTEVKTWNSQYSNIDYYIADATTDTETLMVYRGKWIDGADITAENQPVVGAIVVVNGDLKVYNDIKEFDSYSKIVSYTAPDAGVDGVEVDNANAPVEYFNLQGVKVANPTEGLYIVRQGSKVSKQVIR